MTVALLGEDAAAALDDLASLLAACVAGGASVGFMAPFKVDAARAWWQPQLPAIAAQQTPLFVAHDAGRIVGCVMLEPAGMPNQRHRAEVKKLLVLPAARRQGHAARLMAALETHSRALRRTLLTLDTTTGEPAEQLYAGWGYTRAGVIPGYADLPDGRAAGTTIFWKRLA